MKWWIDELINLWSAYSTFVFPAGSWFLGLISPNKQISQTSFLSGQLLRNVAPRQNGAPH